MSCWTKPELENMLEDVVNELDLSDLLIEKHGQEGTAPAELVRLVLEQKDKEIRMLKQGFVSVIRCPECLKVTDQKELDMFGGLCEDCTNEINHE